MSKKIIILIVSLIILSLILLLMKQFNIGIPCVYYQISGIYCPGCGMTRAMRSMLKLDLYQAFRYNVFSVILLPFIGLYAVGGIYGWLFNKSNFMGNKIPSVIWIIFIIALLLYGILRNIPQFAYLAPTVV